MKDARGAGKRMNSAIVIGALALLVIWGGWGFVAKFALRELDLQIVLWAQVASLALLPIYFFVFPEMTPLKFAGSGIAWALLAGLLGAGGTFVLYLLLRNAPASIVIPISALYPIVTVVLSVIFLNERLTWQQILGLVLAIAAIWLLSTNEN